MLLQFLLIHLVGNAQSEEVTLYNSKGEPTAYIDVNDSDLPIYTWKGLPVAYLSTADKGFHIYGFNGEHLGWYEDGIVRDHEGKIVGFRKDAVNVYTKYESYKAYKQYKPYKSYQKHAPYKPYYKNTFSDETLILFLMRGKRN